MTPDWRDAPAARREAERRAMRMPMARPDWPAATLLSLKLILFGVAGLVVALMAGPVIMGKL